MERLAESVFTDEILPSVVADRDRAGARSSGAGASGGAFVRCAALPGWLLARHLGVAQFIGAHLTLAGERYTGDLDDLHPMARIS
ncbi:MAG: hypothetical protein U0232_15105 [Thermomicrobiales bacterium]